MPDEKVKFEGVEVAIGGTAYVIPPLNFAALRRLRAESGVLAGLSANGGLDDAGMAKIVEIIHSALKRNYPDIKEDDVWEMIDITNVGPIMKAVLEASGFVQMGEPKAPPASADQSTGTNSTAS